MTPEPKYYSPAALREAAGVNPGAFRYHVKHNVAKLKEARIDIPHVGIRYVASKCREYIAYFQCPTRRRKPKP